MVAEGVEESSLCQSVYRFMNAAKWMAMHTCVSGFSLGADVLALDIVKSQGFYGCRYVCHKDDDICCHYEKLNKNSLEFW